MDAKFLKAALMLLIAQIATAIVCWILFREFFIVAALVSSMALMAVFLWKPAVK